VTDALVTVAAAEKRDICVGEETFGTVSQTGDSSDKAGADQRVCDAEARCAALLGEVAALRRASTEKVRF
jgi:hypothetical protein